MEEYLNNIFKDIDSNIRLDKNQKEVIIDDNDNIIVIAGAGTGKTTTIVAKIKYLVEIKQIKPSEILVISFTNKTVTELQERINNDFNIDAKICTFHKFAYDLIKMYDNNYKIIDNSENIIKKIIKSNNKTSFIIKELLKENKYKKASKKYNSDLEYFINFTVENINLYKMSNKIVSNSKKRVTLYFQYLKEINDIYNNYLNDNHLLDFENIIIKATSIINKISFKYKYIIIDEYQDISLNRFNLIKKINEVYKVKNIVVGDDWQSIYSFSGSNINLFLEYEHIMHAKTYKITNTYRNSQQLIDAAGSFIMRNNRQIKKNLTSAKNITYPIEIWEYKNNINIIFINILKTIIKENKKDSNILILGRYNADYKMIISNEIKYNNKTIIYKKEPQIKIDYMTVHSSKGLGYDNVIIINTKNDIYGFPSKIVNDEIKQVLINKEENIWEERRLFYVALTRTKNKVYILTPRKSPSIFIKEMVKKKGVLYKKM